MAYLYYLTVLQGILEQLSWMVLDKGLSWKWKQDVVGAGVTSEDLTEMVLVH